MHKFTNPPLMVVHEKLATTPVFEGPVNGHHVVLNAVAAATNRPIDDYFLLDFAASSTTSTTTSTSSSLTSPSVDQNSKEGASLSSPLVIGKKPTLTTTAQAPTPIL